MNPLQTYYDRIKAAVPEATRIMVDCSMNLWPEHKKDAIFGSSSASERYSCGVHFHNEAGGGDLSKLKRREFWDQRGQKRLEVCANKEAFRVAVSGHDLDTVCSVAIEAYRSYLVAGRDIDEDIDGITSDGRSMKQVSEEFKGRVAMQRALGKPLSLKLKSGEKYKAIPPKDREGKIVLPSERPVLRIDSNHLEPQEGLKIFIKHRNEIGFAVTDGKPIVMMDSEAPLDPKMVEKVLDPKPKFGFWDDDPNHK